MLKQDFSIERLPTCPVRDWYTTRFSGEGIYFVLEGQELLYIGSSVSPRSRLGGHHLRHDFESLSNAQFAWLPISTYSSGTPDLSLKSLEAAFTAHYNPPFNKLNRSYAMLNVPLPWAALQGLKKKSAVYSLPLEFLAAESLIREGWKWHRMKAAALQEVEESIIFARFWGCR